MAKDTKQPNSLVVRGSFACICKVRDEGYEWETNLRPAPGSSSEVTDSQASPWLVDGFVDGQVFYCHYFQPLYELDLHHQFGRLNPTCKRIKRFADRCGLLGKDVFLIYPELEGQPQTTKTGESLQFWKQEIEKMSALLDLWDYIQNQKKVTGLHIQWHYQPMRISLEWHFPSGVYLLHSIAHEGIFSDKEVITRLFREGIDPARYYLLNQLEERLAGHVNPQLNLFNTEQLLMIPDSLLSALYLSFALEVSEQMGPKVKCRCGCGRDFFPEKGRRYFDERCKKRDWWRHNRGSRTKA